MGTARDAAKNVVDESNPVGFLKRLRGVPVLGRILRVFDRFL